MTLFNTVRQKRWPYEVVRRIIPYLVNNGRIITYLVEPFGRRSTDHEGIIIVHCSFYLMSRLMSLKPYHGVTQTLGLPLQQKIETATQQIAAVVVALPLLITVV
jgi:hypothetical protein